MSALLAFVGGAILLLAGPPSEAQACAGWHSVAGQSHLRFIVTFEGAEAPGEFRRFEVCLGSEPGGPDAARLKVRVDVASADMDSSDLNEAIAEPDWFDAGSFPQALFVSERIEPSGGNGFVAQGTLTLKGTSRPVDVPFAWRDGGATRVMSGELVLERGAFGIGSGEWATAESIGQVVTVRFEVTLERGP